MRGGAFNLRIVSDSVPDWSSRANFVRSALSAWGTDHEKALAQFRWSYLCRRVGSTWSDAGRPVHDPVLFFNSYGLTMCGDISSINVALWEAAGWKARTIDVHDHVVAEVFYDGAWHMFDNDFCNYFLNEKGAVAGGEDLHKGREKKPGEHYLFDHCPTASCPGGRIYMGPSSWAVPEVARDWWDVYRPRLNVSGAQAGHRYVLGVRPGESYTRHWRPLGLGPDYSRPHRGKDPAAEGSTPLRNCRANGLWEWRPDLTDTAALFASENVRCSAEGLKPAEAARPASATFRVTAANVITSADLEARAQGQVRFSVSGDGGLAWSPLETAPAKEKGALRAQLGEPVGGRLEYLLRVELDAGAGLAGLVLRTVTQVNPHVLPALRLGRNEVAAVSDDHLEYLTFWPRLTDGRHEQEVFEARGWQSLKGPRAHEPSIRGTGPCELVLRAPAPRQVRHVRMAATALMSEPAADLVLEVSFDGGKSWKLLGRRAFSGPPEDLRFSAETREVPEGAREVLLRYRFEDGGSGLLDVFAQVGCEPAGGFMPYEVTYSWSEFAGGKWQERTHAERISAADHRYAVNVGGTRPPRMNWIRVAPAGKGAVGYGDGRDAGEGAGRPDSILSWGPKISTGCAYTVSRKASEAFPDVGGKVLTDGYVSLASYWGLGKINLTGEKNAKRVGELVVWEPGEEVAVTVDLGEARKVGGARVCAVQPNTGVLYPREMIVETSADGRDFAEAGRVGWEEVFFPTADFMHWEGVDSPIYDELPAGGRLDFRFPVILERPVEARYVRFRLAPPEGKGAGIGLWELEVFESVEKKSWSDRIALPGRRGEK